MNAVTVLGIAALAGCLLCLLAFLFILTGALDWVMARLNPGHQSWVVDDPEGAWDRHVREAMDVARDDWDAWEEQVRT
jgi:hypothetical protein